MKKLATLIICAALTLGIANPVNAGMFDSLFGETDPMVKVLGPKPDKSIHDKLVHMYQQTAIDPESVRVTVDMDKIEKTTIGMKSDGLMLIGWMVPHTVNAKNRMGGYAGPEKRVAYYFDDSLIAGCETPEASTKRFLKVSQAIKIGYKPSFDEFEKTLTTQCTWANQSKAMTPEHHLNWLKSLPKE